MQWSYIESACLNLQPQIATLGVGFVTPGEQSVWDIRDRWALHLFRYNAEIEINGHRVRCHPGLISLEPPRTITRYVSLPRRDSHLYVTFMPGGRTRPRPAAEDQPYQVDSGTACSRISEQLLDIIGVFPRNRLRANVMFWNILWEVCSERGVSSRTRNPVIHPVVAKATTLIEHELATVLRVPDLAARCGMSQNSLIRLFQREFTTGVVDYIQRRRADRALQLLQETDLPIKVIAAEVGIPDINYFNKVMRRFWGKSPRALRVQ